MKKLFATGIAFMLVSCAQTGPVTTTQSAAPSSKSVAEQLLGTWKVDLRAEPGGAPYFQNFVIESVDVATRSIKGSFYNSEISWSRTNTAWGKTVVTFMTSDGQGDYVHTATVQGTMMTGTSTAKHRNLLVPWTAQWSMP